MSGEASSSDSNKNFERSPTSGEISTTLDMTPMFDPSKFLGKITYELNSKNFLTWQFFVKGILRHYKLDDWVEQEHTPKTREDDNMEIDGKEFLKAPYEYNTYYEKTVTSKDLDIDNNVQFIIRSTLGPNSLIDIQDKSLTAYQMWKLLEAIHLGDEIDIKNALIDETNKMKFDQKTSFSRFLNKLNSNLNRLECLGVKISTEEKVNLLYRSLPNEWRSMNILDQGSWEECKNYTTNLINRLQTIEKREREGNDGIHHVFSMENHRNKYNSKNKNWSRKNNFNNIYQGNTNYNQRQENYIKKNPVDNDNYEIIRNKELKCFFCHKKGHIERFCQTKKRLSRQLQTTNTNNSRNRKNKQVNLALNSSNNEYDDINYSDLFNIDYNTSFDTYDNAKQCNFIYSEPINYSIWTLDSGATSHMSSDNLLLSNTLNHKEPINYANGRTSFSKSIGNVEGMINDEPIKLKEVLYIPDIKRNLISIAKMVRDGYTITFKKENNDAVAYVIDGNNKNRICRIRANEQDTFNVCIRTNKRSLCNSILKFKDEEDYQLWHRRMGHLCLDNKQHEQCEVCIESKMKNKPYPLSENKSKDVFDLVHIDLVGPIRPSIYNNSYFLTILDDYSRYSWVIFVKNKLNIHKIFAIWYNKTSRILNKKITFLRSDNGREFCSQDFRNMCNSYGITQQFTVPNNPQQNGRAERLNGILIQVATSLLMDGKLSKGFWEDAVQTANYLHNRFPHNGNSKLIPYEIIYKSDVDYSPIHVFGCKVKYLDNHYKFKFDGRSNDGIFLGYDENSKGYKIFDIKSRKIVIKRVVEFLENQPGNYNYDSRDVVIETENQEKFLENSSENQENFWRTHQKTPQENIQKKVKK